MKEKLKLILRFIGIFLICFITIYLVVFIGGWKLFEEKSDYRRNERTVLLGIGRIKRYRFHSGTVKCDFRIGDKICFDLCLLS